MTAVQKIKELPLYYRYWGKARSNAENGPAYHLLPFHCLDVAGIADVWWQCSARIRQCFTKISGLSEMRSRSWLLFFIALHDYGKFDLRFQRKAPEAWKTLNIDIISQSNQLSGLEIKAYYHGPAGLYWFYKDFKERFATEGDFCFDENDDWMAWYSWLAPVVGHHGVVPNEYKKDSQEFRTANVPPQILEAFKQARLQWLNILEQLFLVPAGLSLKDAPPLLERSNNGQSPAAMLAGFCCVADWLGSSERFIYDDQPCEDLAQWYDRRLSIANIVLQDAGVISLIKPYQSIDVLLDGSSPRQMQCLVEQLPKQSGLTLIEASTGSGKTETALAYAWQLLDSGLADSIVFALPTQATANAMLERLEKIAPRLFANQANVVLAHGRARYQPTFIDLKQACRAQTVQGNEEAWAQCGNWLAQSRKRVFLGQIGVCTVDQVLV